MALSLAQGYCIVGVAAGSFQLVAGFQLLDPCSRFYIQLAMAYTSEELVNPYCVTFELDDGNLYEQQSGSL